MLSCVAGDRLAIWRGVLRHLTVHHQKRGVYEFIVPTDDDYAEANPEVLIPLRPLCPFFYYARTTIRS